MSPTPLACEADEQDLEEQDLEELNNPPISPQASKNQKKPKIDKKGNLVFYEELFSDSWLEPFAKELCEWWNNHKAGARSKMSFNLLKAEFKKILADESVNGDPRAIIHVLECGIAYSINSINKKFMSITYANWLSMNKRSWIELKRSRCKTQVAKPNSSNVNSFSPVTSNSVPLVIHKGWTAADLAREQEEKRRKLEEEDRLYEEMKKKQAKEKNEIQEIDSSHDYLADFGL